MKTKRFTTALVSGIAAIGMVATLGLAGCGSSSSSDSSSSTDSSATAEAVELQIFAANSLEKALPEVQDLYTESHPEVTFADTQFKASGDLVEQLSSGASADILITASTSTMDDAADLIDADTRTDMFLNDLVIVAAQDSDITISSLEDVVNVEGNIAIGESATVPAGKYANQALYSVGLYTDESGDGGEYAASIADKINLADKVGTAASYVSTGDCVIGFVYSSDVYRYDGIKVVYETPSDSHKDIKYPGAVLADSENADVAADFIEFCLTDPDAQQIFANYGFTLAS